MINELVDTVRFRLRQQGATYADMSMGTGYSQSHVEKVLQHQRTPSLDALIAFLGFVGLELAVTKVDNTP